MVETQCTFIDAAKKAGVQHIVKFSGLSGERLKGMEAMVHPETHTAMGISPTTFAEFARRNAGAFLGESVYVGLQ